MSQFFEIHPANPQPRLITEAVKILRSTGVIVYPTDATYALGCRLTDANALDRIRSIRRLQSDHLMTLVCKDLSDLSTYAQVDNASYRLIRRATPGPFTFILKASRDVPRRVVGTKRKTIGLRIPDSEIARALLKALHEPILSTTMILPDEDFPLTDPKVFRSRLEHDVDAILDGGALGQEFTTLVDLENGFPTIIRQGLGILPGQD